MIVVSWEFHDGCILAEEVVWWDGGAAGLGVVACAIEGRGLRHVVWLCWGGLW